MSDKELIQCFQRNDRKAQAYLFSHYADRMFRVVLRYVKDEDDAEDILITAFTKIFDAIKNFSYRNEGGLEAWIRRIVINQSLMWLRKSNSFSVTERLDDMTSEPDLEQLASLEVEDILAMISRLPLGYRTVFNLHVIEGYSHDEISQLLNTTEATSRSQLFKAKSLLKKMLTQEGYHYGT